MRKIICGILLATAFFSFGQEAEKKLYNWFDNTIGLENTTISQGVKYKENFLIHNDKHPFYKSFEYVNGSIMYNGNLYNNVYLKYDLFSEEISILLKGEQKSIITIQLFKNAIDSFTIYNTHFVKVISENDKLNRGIEYYEEAYKSNFIKLLIKYSKERKEVLYKRKIYFEYVKKKNNYLVFYNNEYIKIKSKKSILKAFPKQKSYIVSFFKTNKLLRKKDFDRFLTNLIKGLSDEMSKNKTLI
jgi:hypothetical protein